MVALGAGDVAHDTSADEVIFHGVIYDDPVVGVVACCNGGVHGIGDNPVPRGELLDVILVVVAPVGIEVTHDNGICCRLAGEIFKVCQLCGNVGRLCVDDVDGKSPVVRREGGLEGRAFKFVLVYDIKRFGRGDNDEAGYYRFQLRRNGVEIIYVSENFNGDDTGNDAPNEICTDANSRKLYIAGYFTGTVDFDPTAATIDEHTSQGGYDGYCVFYNY